MPCLRPLRRVLVASLALGLAACGDDGSSDGPSVPPATSPEVTLTFGIKELRFTWGAVPGATFYRVLESADGASAYVQAGNLVTGTSATLDVALWRRVSASYVVEACNAAGCNGSAPIPVGSRLATAIGYLKASNTGANLFYGSVFGDQFGSTVALSADGSTLAVGAPYESSGATAIDGSQGDDSAPGAGAVYLFSRAGGSWAQAAYVKASNTGAGDCFGFSVALSADGDTLAVGAVAEPSSATGINGNEADDSATWAGAVYVFSRAAGSWSQQAYVKASNTDAGDQFGRVVALSADGDALAVGAPGEGSGATGIDGNQGDDSAGNSGAVYVFSRTGGSWAQQAYVKASNTGSFEYDGNVIGDGFGSAVALSADGSTLAVGAPLESSGATGVGGDQGDGGMGFSSGAVYVFSRAGESWAQRAYVKASNTHYYAGFGSAVALSGDGDTLAVGAPGESSSATGIGGDQGEGSASGSGAVYVFSRAAGSWAQQAYVKASNTGAGDEFGDALALSADGDTLAVGASYEDSGATGNGGNQGDDTAASSGAAYVFSRAGGSWSQRAYLKASNAGAADRFGSALALTAGGDTLAIGALGEASDAVGIGGDQADDSIPAAGAVYLY